MQSIPTCHVTPVPFYHIEYLRVLGHRGKNQLELRLPAFRHVELLVQCQSHSLSYGILHSFLVTQISARSHLNPRIRFETYGKRHHRSRIGQYDLLDIPSSCIIGIQRLQTGIDDLTFSK